ncbi:MAG TPA: hypothetical protein VJZ04_00240 [Lachnospiraceae bacterium]|nr:hypothetical protein [Lachnospiraceae bacterium]
MKKLKMFLSISLMVVMLFSLTACGTTKKNGSTDDIANNTGQSSVGTGTKDTANTTNSTKVGTGNKSTVVKDVGNAAKDVADDTVNGVKDVASDLTKSR